MRSAKGLVRKTALIVHWLLRLIYKRQPTKSVESAGSPHLKVPLGLHQLTNVSSDRLHFSERCSPPCRSNCASKSSDRIACDPRSHPHRSNDRPDGRCVVRHARTHRPDYNSDSRRMVPPDFPVCPGSSRTLSSQHHSTGHPSRRDRPPNSISQHGPIRAEMADRAWAYLGPM